MKTKTSHFRRTSHLIFWGLGVLLLVGATTAVYAHRDMLHIYTFPGSLSNVNRSGEMLGGFASHAMFEQSCNHCHAPVHCITDTKCQDCHLDIARQRIEAEGLHSLLPGAEKCQTCHKEHRGRDVVISEVLLRNIDHQALTGFDLALHETRFDGEAMTCEDCHTQGRFAAEEVSCVACHQDADGELMADHSAEHGEECLACHDGSGTIVEFDHDGLFALEAGHESLGCVACHQDFTFVGTAVTCAGCHEEPDVHAGQFGQECERCHTAVAWAPAQLTHHRFELTHGATDHGATDHGATDQGVTEPLACNSCHVTSYTAVSCLECHPLPDMQIAHPPDQVPEYTPGDCISCHPTGQPADTAPLAQAGK